MNTVQLQKNGIVVDEHKKPISEPLRYLNYRVQLADGYSLRSFFNMIIRYPVLAEINAFFQSYLEQYHACPKKNCNAAGFDYLAFSKTIEMIGFPGEPRLEIYHSLSGVLGNETGELKSSQLDGLLDLPVVLGKLKHVVFGDKVDVFEFDTVFGLFEFIDGIAWELSFHGTPEACGLRR
jgi:hypothetical protein